MSIAVTCAKCNSTFRVKDEFAGKQGRCPKCREVLSVPAACAAAMSDDKPAVARKPIAAASAPSAAKAAQPAAPKPAVNTLVDELTAGRTLPTISEGELLAAFKGDIERVRPGAGYWAALILVGAFMVLLPVIYVGIICLVAYGMYLHAVHDVWVFRSGHGGGRALFGAAIFYVGVLVAGGIALLFMIKPLFARPAQFERRRSLTRNGEPLLFALVDRICDAVGAQRPRRIDVDCQVNAAASFRQGFWSMVVGGDMVLTIGLSLVAGMNVQQFAGVLAHEFGHFSQGVGMRMSYLIRSISFWFTRVVYERDEWDQRLIVWSQDNDSRIIVVLWFARFLVWCSRRILWVLMLAGHAVAGYLLRQMEFDADRYETRLGGSATFEQSSRRLATLSVAYQGAFADLQEFQREGRLGDNLPRLVAVNAEQIPPDVRTKIDKAVDESTTGVFDTHPCDKDRIQSARRENAAGVFQDRRPAASLFTDFDSLCRNATWDFYRGVFGPNFRPSDMHSTDDLLARQGRDVEDRKALVRYFQGTFSVLRLPRFRADIPEVEDLDAKATAVELRDCRAKMLAEAAAMREALKSYDADDTRLMEVHMADALAEAEIKVQAKEFSVPLASGIERRDVANAASSGQDKVRAKLDAYDALVGRRTNAALALLGVPQLAKRLSDAQARRIEAERLLPILSILSSRIGQILELRNTNVALQILTGRLVPNQQNPPLFKAIASRMRTESGQIRALSEPMASYRYPFDHAKGSIMLSEYAVDGVPTGDDLSAVLNAGSQMLDNLLSLCVRICGRLVATAEAVETALGLPQMPEPKPDADSKPTT
jgi:Zn-dependent protease with chaperone function